MFYDAHIDELDEKMYHEFLEYFEIRGGDGNREWVENDRELYYNCDVITGLYHDETRYEERVMHLWLAREIPEGSIFQGQPKEISKNVDTDYEYSPHLPCKEAWLLYEDSSLDYCSNVSEAVWSDFFWHVGYESHKIERWILKEPMGLKGLWHFDYFYWASE